MHLNDHGLWERHISAYEVGSEKDTNNFHLCPIETEESVFQAIGLDYLEPHKRNFSNLKIVKSTRKGSLIG